jgi:ADP-ribosylglycohydrolase
MDLRDKIKGCFYGGAIGDCMGALFENKNVVDIGLIDSHWYITDDTQLTLATVESIITEKKATPAKIAETFVRWFNKKRITGIGSSTLKALQELQVGGHWALVGRQGEYAAGNGAAMRIAPLAFIDADRQTIRDVCRITHKNDEAYTGALAVVESVKAAIAGEWNGNNSLVSILQQRLPDTQVRDRLIELKDETATVGDVAKKYGNSGYVVHSVPLAVYAAQRILQTGFESIMLEIIQAGGDTDTTCSIAGQLMGAQIGLNNIPSALINKLNGSRDAGVINNIITAYSSFLS